MKVATSPSEKEELASRPTILRQIWVYALEKPIVFTGMFYGYVSFIGLTYNTVYFNRFGINILEFYELQDFLLGGLRLPFLLSFPLFFVVIAFIAGILMLGINRAVNRMGQTTAKLVAKESASPARDKVLRPNEFIQNIRSITLWMSRYLTLVCIIGAMALSVLLIINLANTGLLSDRSRYCTYITGGLLSDSPLTFIGTSQGFYFLQQIGTSEVHVIPRKEVLRMTKMGTASIFCTDHIEASPPWM